MFTVTQIPTIMDISERWKRQYFIPTTGGWRQIYININRQNSEEIYFDICQAKTLDEVDEAIGNTVWTRNHCSECMISSREPMVSMDINDGEYDHTLCSTCLDLAKATLNQER